MKIESTMVEKAYKKLKSSVYFDKTQLILRNAIVEFEKTHNNVDDYLHSLFNKLNDDAEFDELKNNILDSISVLYFPKSLHKDDRDIISNLSSKKITIDKLQYFIDMKVEGHILGVLWIMLIGYQMDKGVYEHSYGNRIRKGLINELSEVPTYSPYLFEPYFLQYESWRDKALSEAKNHMKLGQDVVIITMDFEKYYYSINADKSVFDKILEEFCPNDSTNIYFKQNDILKRLNNFVYSVIEKYSEQFGKEFKGRKILPIGFLPSNILGNWCLRNFDKAVVDGWNPVYYGRYVDDILIVDKIERNSEIYNDAKAESLHSKDIIEFFLTQCSRWQGKGHCCEKSKDTIALLEVNLEETDKAKKKAEEKGLKGDDIVVYRINPKYNVISGNTSETNVQNDKVKIFYFSCDESVSLLMCFKERIAKIKSEFRHLPEDESVFQKDDYNEIYSLKNSESPNKLRGVDGIEIDKFELSKFLGKYLRIGGLVDNSVESKFEKDVLKIFDSQTIVDNYSAWEKVIEIFVIAERFDALVNFVGRICESVKSIECSPNYSKRAAKKVKKSLYRFLHSILCRAFSLVWKKDSFSARRKIYSKNKDFLKGIPLEYDENGKYENYLIKFSAAYCHFCMVDNYVLPFNISILPIDKIVSKELEVNLTRFNEVLSLDLNDWNNKYKYFPFLVNMYDFSVLSFIKEITGGESFTDYEEIHDQQNQNYIMTNYNLRKTDDRWRNITNLIYVNKFKGTPVDTFRIEVGKEKKSRLRLAVANVRLNYFNFKNVVEGTPNRSYKRYHELSMVVNQALDQHADMLIMPEAYVPFEWLPILARTCAKNNMAIITGIEHIKYKDKIFNFAAIILPYSYDDNKKCALISFHLKRHYAPYEKELINGYRLQEVRGTCYELYKWNDCYFPVYCCYELTSISDRALFQSYADLVVSVECNRDVNYYSNILESLSRDMHCYCVQVNTSDYGDSRITKPAKTEEKDIIRTKGGINSTVLIGEVDINELREFQLKEFALQKGNKFKPTPPGFKPDIVLKKIRGEIL